MKNKGKNIVFTVLISMMALTGCSKEPELSSSMTKPDFNDFNQVVDDDKAKTWIINTYNNFIKLDAMEVTTSVENFKYKDVRKFMPDEQSFDTTSMPNLNEFVRLENRLEINAKLEQKMSIMGLNAIEPNRIKQAYNANSIYCSMTKPGLNPDSKNKAELEDGIAEMYVKDNLQYVNISNKNLRDFFPYVLFGFGDYNTIEDAKQEASNVPEKFYDPTPVYKDEDLPLNKKMTSVAGVSLDVVLMKLIKKNSEADKRFLTFLSNGNDLKVQFTLKKDHLIDIIKTMKDKNGKVIGKTAATTYVNNFVAMNSFNIETIIKKNYFVDYVNADIDLSFSIPIEDENNEKELEAIDSYSIDLLTHSWYNFENPVVVYPVDLNSYKEYDLKMPEIKLPGFGNDDTTSPIEPF